MVLCLLKPMLMACYVNGIGFVYVKPVNGIGFVDVKPMLMVLGLLM